MINPQIHSADPADIIVDERTRKEFKKESLDKLASSISKRGQLQPGVCRIDEEGKIHIVAGEFRLRACQALRRPFLFLLEDETDPITLLEIEIEENTCRTNLTFLEEAKATQRLHIFRQMRDGEAKPGEPGGHGIKDTAEILGRSYGIIAEDLELAEFSSLPEIQEAKNKTDAKKIIKRMKEEFIQSEALRRAKEKEDKLPLGDPLDDPRVLALLNGEPGEEPKVDRQAIDLDKVNFFKKFIHQGKMEEILQTVPDEEYSIVIFDPPWGVDLEAVSNENKERIYYRDDYEVFHTQLQNWLDLLYKKMKPNSHLYMFFGIVNHEFVYKTLKESGFITNQMPLIWYKQGSHTVRTPDVWPGRSYEPIAYARKGSKNLVKKGAPDVIITPAPTPYMKGLHPTAKHPDIILELLKRSAMPGDKILDPMAGSGMTGVACEMLRSTHSLEWTEIEEKKGFWELSVINVSKGYFKLINVSTMPQTDEAPFYVCTTCQVTGVSDLLELNLATGRKEICPTCKNETEPRLTPIPEDFKTLDLDTETGKIAWKDYWKLHPEKQEEMIRWKKEKENGH